MIALSPLLFAVALATPSTATFGGDKDDNTGKHAYKLNTYTVVSDVQLLRFEHYLDTPPGAEFTYVVYRQQGMGWQLLWDSGAVTRAPGASFKSSPPILLDLAAGERYAMGIYLLGDEIGYFYDSDLNGPEYTSWGSRDGALWSSNNVIYTILNPLIDSEDSFGYYQRVTTEAPLVDSDGDGFNSTDDCDDADPTVYPGASEDPCGSVDSNCDGVAGNPNACGGSTADTGTPSADTGYPNDEPTNDGISTPYQDEEIKVGGCGGCSALPASSLGWVLLPALLGLSRRRRHS